MALNVEQFRARLAEKITSKEQFDKLLIEAHNDNLQMIGNPQVKSSGGGIVSHATYYKPTWDYLRPQTPRPEYNPSFNTSNMWSLPDNALHHTRWWLAREWLRIRYGVYTMTEPLWYLCYYGHAAWAAHCATDGDDPTLIAYTPDPAAGEADRQIRTTLSKMMRKINNAVSDDALRDTEATHRAEMDTTLDIVTGPEIVKAYLAAGPSGNGSCMTKGLDYFSYNEGHHPVSVYDAPGFGLALVRADGKIKSRSIVWVNPDDPSDKRYVRIYGDGVLKRKLERNGYRLAGFAGARLKRIDLTRHPDANTQVRVSVATYLDAPGGNGSGVSELSAQHVVPDGDQWFVLVSNDDVESLARNTGKRVLGFSSTSGWMAWQPSRFVHLSDMRSVCPLSGKTINILTDRTTLVYVGGAAQTVLRDAIPANWRTAYYVTHEGARLATARVSPDTPTFEHGGYVYVEHADVRRAVGFVRLWSRYYEDKWFLRGDVRLTEVDTGDGSRALIKNEDAAIVINREEADDTLRWVHREQVDKSACIPVQRLHSTPTWAYKDDPRLRTTVSGRKVILDVHQLVELFDGRVDFRRNCDSASWYGYRAWFRSDDGAPAFDAVKPQLFKFIREWVEPYGAAGSPDRVSAAASYAGDHLRYFIRPVGDGWRWAASEAPYYSPKKAEAQMRTAFETARAIIGGTLNANNCSIEYMNWTHIVQAAHAYLMVEAALLGTEDVNLTVRQPETQPATPTTPATDERFVLAA